MKTNHLKKIIVGLAVVFIASFSYAQMQGPGDPGGEPVGKPPVGGAPINGGFVFLLALGTLYGGNKIYHLVTDAAFNEQK